MSNRFNYMMLKFCFSPTLLKAGLSNLFLLLFLFLFACDSSRIFEGYKDFNNQKWSARETVSFSFEVQEINTPYTIYYQVRNMLSYPYYNIYVTYELTDADGKVITSKMIESNLMHPQTGEPLGKSAGSDVFDNRFPLLENYRFAQAGTYQIRLRQYMRMDELPDILAVGIRVEKSE